MEGSPRLPSFIPFPRDEVGSSPDRKSRTRRRQVRVTEHTDEVEEEHQILTGNQQESSVSLTREEHGNFCDIDDPIEWERRYFIDLLATDEAIDWEIDFLSRLNAAVVKPKRCSAAFARTASELNKKRSVVVDVYETTILGALVARTSSPVPDSIVQATLELCSRQAECSQLQRGCTPLRSAVCNTSHVTPETLSLLVQACPETVHLEDGDGLSPIDHCLYNIVLGSSDTTTDATDRLQALLKFAKPLPTRSPLIRLLSLMNTSTDQYILRCTQLLLTWDPTLAKRTSTTTGCTPLHVAVRNNKNNDPTSSKKSNEQLNLIRTLGQHYLDVFRVRNFFGDTVLHVVSATGATDEVLRYVLEQTLASVPYRTRDSPHPVVWSVNSAGYTPADLEWIRYVECGGQSRPLDARGVPPAVGSLYEELLQRMCQTARGAAWQYRIQWIVDAALPDHHISALLVPHGPTLPRPVVDLLSASGPPPSLHEVVVVRVPLASSLPNACAAWQAYTLPLIDISSSQVRDARTGRLPLHTALAWPGDDGVTSAVGNEQPARNSVVQSIVDAFPQGLDHHDPVTCLFPFQMAARNPLVSMDTLYRMLRTHPGILACGRESDAQS